jgi:hypothetical protein
MGRRVQMILVAANLLFWVPILAWTVFAQHPYDPPAHIEDPAFAEAAEPICAVAQADIADLGLPTEVRSPAERAALTDHGNQILRGMVAELRDLPAPPGEEGEWVHEWLDDWDTHIADRQAWADELAAGRDGPFVETPKQGFQISRAIDEFAEVNRMDSCKTTGDV